MSPGEPACPLILPVQKTETTSGLALCFTDNQEILAPFTVKQFDDVGTTFVVTVELNVPTRTAVASLSVNGQLTPSEKPQFQVMPIGTDATKDFSAIGVTPVNEYQAGDEKTFTPPYGTVGVKLHRFALSIVPDYAMLRRF